MVRVLAVGVIAGAALFVGTRALASRLVRRQPTLASCDATPSAVGSVLVAPPEDRMPAAPATSADPLPVAVASAIRAPSRASATAARPVGATPTALRQAPAPAPPPPPAVPRAAAPEAPPQPAPKKLDFGI
jgi:hypothetical protein